MHVAKAITVDCFAVTVGNAASGGPELLFPDWKTDDRVGIVLDRPMGVIGGNLAFTAGHALFYQADPRRKSEMPQYAPLYAFHVGGRYGIHTMMDVVPDGKEVFIGRATGEVTQALCDRGITRLLVPQRPANSDSIDVSDTAVGWSSAWWLRENLRSCYAYEPSTGRVSDADVSVRSTNQAPEQLVDDTLSLGPSDVEFFRNATPEFVAKAQIGHTTVQDTRLVADSVEARLDEVPEDLRTRLLAERREQRRDGTIEQTYRSISPDDALLMLGALRDD